MPKNFVRRTYDAWIHTHARRFRYPPWIAESRKQGFTLRFRGLTPTLTLQVRQQRSWGSAELMIHDTNGVYWDIIGDFDLSEVRTVDGRYRCKWCEGSTSYRSRAALWEAHVFEPLLDWINRRTADQWVCLYGTPEQDIWGAQLLSCTVIAGSHCVDTFPLVMGLGGQDIARRNRSNSYSMMENPDDPQTA